MTKKKTLIFYIVLAVAFLLPSSMTAQSLFKREGNMQPQAETSPTGVFGKTGAKGDPSYPGMGNQGFNQVPVGSGVLMLIAAGAGYAVIKRKKSRKSSITF